LIELVTTLFPVSYLLWIGVFLRWFGCGKLVLPGVLLEILCKDWFSHEKREEGRLSQNAGGTSEPTWDLDDGFKRRECREEMPVFAGAYGMAQVKDAGRVSCFNEIRKNECGECLAQSGSTFTLIFR
jgi:hypothetical protein